MSFNLVPTSTDLHLLDAWLSGKPIYCHLVEVLPDITAEVRADCLIAGGGNYQPITLQQVAIAATVNGGAKITADPVYWPGLLNDGTPLEGCSFFRQASANPSSSDYLIATIPFVDSAGLLKPFIPDGTDFSINLSDVPFLETRSRGT